MLISGAKFFQPGPRGFYLPPPPPLKRSGPDIPPHKLAVIAVYTRYHYIVELHFISIIISRRVSSRAPSMLYLPDAAKSADHRGTTPMLM